MSTAAENITSKSSSESDAAPDYLEIHQVEVIDFALQGNDLARKMSLSKKVMSLVYNPRAKYTRRGKLTKWVERV